MLQEILSSLDWNDILMSFITFVGTCIVIPFAKKAKEMIELSKYQKYAAVLYDAVDVTVKAIYQQTVDSIKDDGKLDDEEIALLKELSIQKIKQNLSTAAYACLKSANEDFDEWILDLVDAKIKEIKLGVK